MKKELLIFFLATAFVVKINAQPDAPDILQINQEKKRPLYFGVMGGFNFRFNKFTHTKIEMDGLNILKETTTEAATAFGGNMGAMLNIPVDYRLSIQFNPMYSVEAYHFNNKIVGNGLFEFPMLAVFTKKSRKRHAKMMMIGPFVAYVPQSFKDPFSGNRNHDYNIKTMGGIILGIAHQHNNGTNFGIRCKLNGGNTWQEEFFKGSVTETYNTSDLSYSTDYRLNSWQVFFGYTFGMRKKNYLNKQPPPSHRNELAAKIDSMVMVKIRSVEMKLEQKDNDYKSQPTEDTATAETSPYRGSGDPLKGLDVAGAKKQAMEIGEYYALIIGIDNYSGEWQPLKNGAGDAKATEWVLKSKYKFDYFRTLYNDEATRKEIITQLEWLAQNVKEKDNVFIYFSGHGEYSKQFNKGYWVPADAKQKTTAEYISNTDIQTYLSGIRSKHTLLISDACFSGDIFRGSTVTIPFEETERYYTKVHTLNSRQALTSGGVEPVLDGGKDGHSVFAYYMLKSLSENNENFYDAGQLFNDLKIPVINNSDQTPVFQAIKNTGDEGGQFIFIKK